MLEIYLFLQTWVDHCRTFTNSSQDSEADIFQTLHKNMDHETTLAYQSCALKFSIVYNCTPFLISPA